jgi:hypothetical protein
MTEKNNFGNSAIFTLPNRVSCRFQCVFDLSKKHALNVDFCANENNYNDWQNKVTIQLSIDEISALICLFIKLKDDCKFQYHGKNKNKSLTVKKEVSKNNQQIQFVFSLMVGGANSGYIYLKQNDGFRVYKLCMEQLCAFYQQSEQDIINSLKNFY